MSEGFALRAATMADVPALRALIEASLVELQRPVLRPEEIEASRAIMGLDTALIADGTYMVAALADGTLVGAGGWSRRATAYGGDHSATRDAALLDPARERARIRAMYTAPGYARRGIGRAILAACEAAARSAGFSGVELSATLAGLKLYEACGYVAEHHFTDATGGLPVPLVRMGKRLD